MAKGRTRTRKTYQENLKCCTYKPWTPNYSVGEILSSGDEKLKPAQAILRRKIERREFVLPIGVLPSIAYQVEFYKKHDSDFGQNPEWLCDYYDSSTNACLLWRQRGAVCTSFHCKHVHGPRGKAFWKSFERYLTYVEMAMMEDCLAHLDFSPRQVSDLLEFLDRNEASATELSWTSLPEKKAREMWNGYFDEQEEFFKKCHRHTQSITREAFHELLGETGANLQDDVTEASQIWPS